MNIANWLFQSARTWPDAPALKVGTEIFCDYSTLARRAYALSRHLRNEGVGAGDRVAIFAANCPEYLEILHACWWVGAVIVPINYKLHPREAGWILENSGTRLLFSSAGELGAATALPAGCAEFAIDSTSYRAMTTSVGEFAAPELASGDALAWLFYTSGTTGRPKGVMLTHQNLVSMCLSYTMDVDSIARTDHSLYAAPMSHGAGLYGLPFIRAGAAHVIPVSRAFRPEEIISLAEKLGDLCFFAAPTMVTRLVKAAKVADFRGGGIKSIIYGGGPMYAADIDAALQQFGPRFVQVYGQGESPMTIAVLPRDLVADQCHADREARRNSVGFAQAPVDVAIWGPDCRPLPTGETGEVVVRGPTVMKGYWDNPEATAQTIVDGWLRTGDLGALDDSGFLTLNGRSRDVIISGGSNIYPREVEEILLQHPAVQEASVVGMPHADWGEIVVAFVSVNPEMYCDEQTLNEWCSEGIASFKRPKLYKFMKIIPKNNYGKILKTELRNLLLK